MILLPDAGIGIFAFASRTYGAPSVPAFKALLAMKATGAIETRPVPVSAGVATGYEAVRAIWRAGDVLAARASLAMNFLMDRDVPHWKAELAKLKAEAGDCSVAEPITASTAMAGRFTWVCAHGRVEGSLLLAPTGSPTLQELRLAVVAP